MASYDVMNREDGDADHVAVTQSDMTRAASTALQAAAAQGSAGQRPSPGGSAEMSAEASPQHHPESENDSAAAAGAGAPADLQEAPESEVGTPDRHGRQPASQDIIHMGSRWRSGSVSQSQYKNAIGNDGF